MSTTAHKYYKPLALDEALEIAHAHGDDFRFLAGGTDAIVNKFQRTETASCYIDITGVEELRGVKKENGFLQLGSLCTLHTLASMNEVREEFPVIADAVTYVASPVIRKSATLGGNLLCANRCVFFNQSEWWRKAAGYCLKCNGDVCIATGGTKNCFSKFSSDMAIALISIDASVEIYDGKQRSIVKLEDIYSREGITPLKLKRTDLLSAILLPLDKNYRAVFKKLRPRKSLEFTSLTSAVSIDKNQRVKIVLGGVDPGPVVAEHTGPADAEEVIRKIIKKARTVDNDVYSRVYRREIARYFLAESFKELARTAAH